MYPLKILNDCGESNDVSELKLEFQKLSMALEKTAAVYQRKWYWTRCIKILDLNFLNTTLTSGFS